MAATDALKITGNDLSQIVRDALVGAVATSTETERQQVLTWAEQMTPLVTVYAAQAAAGDERSREMLAHLAGQAQGKAWELCIALNASVGAGMGDVAVTVARTVGTILAGLVARYGVVLLGL